MAVITDLRNTKINLKAANLDPQAVSDVILGKGYTWKCSCSGSDLEDVTCLTIGRGHQIDDYRTYYQRDFKSLSGKEVFYYKDNFYDCPEPVTAGQPPPEDHVHNGVINVPDTVPTDNEEIDIWTYCSDETGLDREVCVEAMMCMILHGDVLSAMKKHKILAADMAELVLVFNEYNLTD